MERHMLRLTLVLGVLVTIIGGTGVFAVFTDTAEGGPNSVASGAQRPAADLLIAAGEISTVGWIHCGEFEDAATTGGFAVSDLQPGSGATTIGICVSNNGASPVSLAVGAPNLRDIDGLCTGDEGRVDPTCGDGGPGELSGLLQVDFRERDCETGEVIAPTQAGLGALRAGFVTVGSTLEPTEYTCFSIGVYYPDLVSAASVQAAQSDQVTWNFVFQGTAS